MQLNQKYFPELLVVPGGMYVEDGNLNTVNKMKIGKTEVSYWQFNLFLLSNGNKAKEFSYPRDSKYPMTNVSCIEAVEYCNWLSRKKGCEPVYNISEKTKGKKGNRVIMEISINKNANGFRIPNENQWVFCAIGGKFTSFFNCSEFESESTYMENIIIKPSDYVFRESTFSPPNQLGLFGFKNQIWELCYPIEYSKFHFINITFSQDSKKELVKEQNQECKFKSESIPYLGL